MNTALTISHGRMAPCFAGVEIWIVSNNIPEHAAGHAILDGAKIILTYGWHPLGWGRELMRCDVGLLLCSGIDQSTWSSVQGHGIQVIPNAIGDALSVLNAWRSGRLSPPRLWPAYPDGYAGFPTGGCGRGRGMRRFRGKG